MTCHHQRVEVKQDKEDKEDTEDKELRWKDSGDLSRAIAYGVLAALDRSPESFHLSSLSFSSPISSVTSSQSSSALPVADEGGLPAAVRPILMPIGSTTTPTH